MTGGMAVDWWAKLLLFVGVRREDDGYGVFAGVALNF
jgi:hypothetical protein